MPTIETCADFMRRCRAAAAEGLTRVTVGEEVLPLDVDAEVQCFDGVVEFLAPIPTDRHDADPRSRRPPPLMLGWTG